MNFKNLKNTQELQNFLEGTQAIAYSVPGDKADRYSFIQTTLKQFHYRALKKASKRHSDSFSAANDWIFSPTIDTLDSTVHTGRYCTTRCSQ